MPQLQMVVRFEIEKLNNNTSSKFRVDEFAFTPIDDTNCRNDCEVNVQQLAKYGKNKKGLTLR